MKNIFISLAIISLCCFFCCRGKNKPEIQAQKIVSEWTGKQIQYPVDAQCCILGKDTISDLCNCLLQKEYKILLYVDSAGCSDCKLKFFEWKRLIAEADTLFPQKLGFVFFFQPKSRKDMTFLFRKDNFRYPAFIDMNDDLNKLNHFPSQIEYQCFLLDENNKVLMVGNPVLNLNIWDLYKQIITGKISEKMPATTVETSQTEMELQDLKAGKTSEAVFVLKNTGTKPLVIQHVESSCGCTVPEWEKQPVATDKSTEIRVKITPDSPEYFSKTVTVHCNTEKGRITFNIRGTVNE
jgi:hypothetical protein